MGKVRLEKFISEYSRKNKNRNSYPVYSVTNSNGFCTEYFAKDVSSEDKSGYKLVPFGYFAYNPSRINVGSIDCQMKEENVIVSPLYTVFKVENGLNIEYLRYFFKSNYCKHLIQSKVSGSVRFNLKFDTLKSFEINEISNNEQQKAVGLFSSIEDLIKIEEKELSLLNELIKSRFIELFGDVDSNTNGYPSYKIGSQFSLGAGGTPSTQNKEYWDNGTISWIGSNMCQNVVLYENDGKFITEKGYANSSAKLFKPDTVLIALVGATIGKVALLKFETTTNQNVLGMWDIKKNGYDPYYVYYYMQAIYGKFTAIGDGNFKMASKAFVSNLDILKPSLALQTEFSMFVEMIDKLKFNVQQRIEKYKELLNKKMSEYFN